MYIRRQQPIWQITSQILLPQFRVRSNGLPRGTACTAELELFRVFGYIPMRGVSLEVHPLKDSSRRRKIGMPGIGATMAKIAGVVFVPSTASREHRKDLDRGIVGPTEEYLRN